MNKFIVIEGNRFDYKKILKETEKQNLPLSNNNYQFRIGKSLVTWKYIRQFGNAEPYIKIHVHNPNAGQDLIDELET